MLGYNIVLKAKGLNYFQYKLLESKTLPFFVPIISISEGSIYEGKKGTKKIWQKYHECKTEENLCEILVEFGMLLKNGMRFFGSGWEKKKFSKY